MAFNGFKSFFSKEHQKPTNEILEIRFATDPIKKTLILLTILKNTYKQSVIKNLS